MKLGAVLHKNSLRIRVELIHVENLWKTRIDPPAEFFFKPQ